MFSGLIRLASKIKFMFTRPSIWRCKSCCVTCPYFDVCMDDYDSYRYYKETGEM